ncbi:SOS response-associated peptidase [Octadecabacter sp. 1_MG-2023]|uniref:SOS response-associated peptidase n=1 Tax=unclassified Octadecabacter TaxID=196158 RepID=UPI001C07FC5C|nr:MULTISPECIES: SOS response-associated peptidase [unclassified Octadecabacter]MBU2994753.1 SOS response-associated peptidase [Octadecabacter sp. B2R22]MDO6733953.1 SOS response-associated peptidase [Octadecabacter sp. 1_MG-2023]
MCGRMAMTLPHDAMAQMFDAAPANDLPEVPNYNVCPTVHVAAVTSDGGQRRYNSMRWGFIPHWYQKPNGGPLLINARAETIAEKPAFKAACRERRCIIPAAGFYEWERPENGSKLPWFVQRSDGAPLAMAAIWQDWGELGSTAAIVTTSANNAMGRIHHRIPVILEADQWAKWLGEEGKGAATLMTATGEDTLTFHRVDTAVNSNRAHGPELIEPLDV